MNNRNQDPLERLAGMAAEGYVLDETGPVPVCVHPATPFWFVPSPAAADIVRTALETRSAAAIAELVSCDGAGRPREAGLRELQTLARSIAPPPAAGHTGRSHLELSRLSEIWFHLTDACNLECAHCLFGCRPGSAASMDRGVIEQTAAEAAALGCRLFCFTGGEPFVYADFTGLMKGLLERTAASIAVLTNGTLIARSIDALKSLDPGRLHFQVSLDGPGDVNDRIRGRGVFEKAAAGIGALREAGIPFSAVMAVNADTFDAMPGFVRTAHEFGVETVHFMWHFVRGSGSDIAIPPMDALVERFGEAAGAARGLGMTIDNLEAVRARVCAHAGTRFDLANAGWETVAVGPDGSVYPTPAMIGRDDMRAGAVGEDGASLKEIWRAAPLLERVRGLSLLDVPELAAHPWRLILGGGDLDHCYHNPDKTGRSGLLGTDPYLPLHTAMVLTVIAEEAEGLPVPDRPGLILRMGDVTADCPSGGDVNFTRSNYLLSAGADGCRGLVRDFYAERVEQPDETILNPARYEAAEVEFIPAEGRVRSYGCGSPVTDADIGEGETVVDFGSGAGVEVLLAARLAGPAGRAVGVDMTDAMLETARRSKSAVAETLGYDNTEFVKGFLEDVPLEDASADVVISNCVINLCRNKRRAVREIYRILKPGGRLVISDVVCETEPSLAIRADHQLAGECIGGAMVQDYLFALLSDIGFTGSEIVKRFPYRTVQGHPFFSLTFRAYRPGPAREVDVIYGGPFASVEIEEGVVLERGVRARVAMTGGPDPEKLAERGILILDGGSGAIANADIGASCCCGAPAGSAVEPESSSGDEPCCCGSPPESGGEPTEPPADEPCCCGAPAGSGGAVHETGCLVCGAPLAYAETPEPRACARCGRTFESATFCEKGHFVCDLCHMEDPVDVVRSVCTTTAETDMFRLVEEIRSHRAFSLHGPEHHGMVPGVILATYRNLGGEVDDLHIMAGIDRGSQIPGGACGFMGLCGAGAGVGTAFAILIGSNPLRPDKRRLAMEVTARVMKRLSGSDAARCCRRDAYLALRAAAELSAEYLPIRLRAEGDDTCDQFAVNQECMGEDCPFYPAV